jgi:hypothetical protein
MRLLRVKKKTAGDIVCPTCFSVKRRAIERRRSTEQRAAPAKRAFGLLRLLLLKRRIHPPQRARPVPPVLPTPLTPIGIVRALPGGTGWLAHQCPEPRVMMGPVLTRKQRSLSASQNPTPLTLIGIVRALPGGTGGLPTSVLSPGYDGPGVKAQSNDLCPLLIRGRGEHWWASHQCHRVPSMFDSLGCKSPAQPDGVKC